MWYGADQFVSNDPKSTHFAPNGIRIVDFRHVYQVPVGTQILADYGAGVIKVERPDAGDWSRRWGPFVHGVSLPYRKRPAGGLGLRY